MSIDKEKYMKELAKELHKPVKRKFPRRKTTFSKKDETWCLDLVDMSEWVGKNDGLKFMLTVIDGFTRYAWARPLSDKTAVATFSAFEDIVKDSGRKPSKLWTDQGKEFYNRYFQKWCKDNDAILYSTYGEHKSVLVERFNRTLKTEMWQKFTEKNSRRWVDMLPDLVSHYNQRKHSTLGMSPWEASKPKNEEEVAEHVTTKPSYIKKDKREVKFALGDHVRISRVRGHFEKGYLPGWSQEVFIVDKIIKYANVDTPILYELRDHKGEKLKGSFYEQELQKVSPEIADVRLVEKVLRSRSSAFPDDKKEVLVKWLGLSDKHNQWVPAANVVIDFNQQNKREIIYKDPHFVGSKLKLRRVAKSDSS